MDTPSITTCPTCGSPQIKKVRRDWSGEAHGRSYTVPDLEFYECPVCGEKVYNRQAMQKIQSHSPAFAKERTSA
jgi:YgiT-type zinc finger domain-containing protein